MEFSVKRNAETLAGSPKIVVDEGRKQIRKGKNVISVYKVNFEKI